MERGGHLVFEERIGTDHSAGHQLPADYTAVLNDAALAEGELRRIEAKPRADGGRARV